MDTTEITLTTLIFLSYAFFSKRLKGTLLTAPLLFVGAGLFLGQFGIGLIDIDIGHSSIHMIAEFTLILVLFSDASTINVKRLLHYKAVPLRMLGLGVPLGIGIGALLAAPLFPAFSIFELALLAAILAPTDAALGQAVVTDPVVPEDVRQSLNVESGLNDGIALPVILMFAACAQAGAHTDGDLWGWVVFGAKQIIFGPLVGIAVGCGAARLVDFTVDRGWMSGAAEGIAVVSTAILAYTAAELVHGNGFISAFVAGLVFGNSVRHTCSQLFEFMESEGQLLTLFTFFLFGAAMLPESLHDIALPAIVFALLSLFVIRPAAIALSLTGAPVDWASKAFYGWFGPRGLASVLFALLIVEGAPIEHGQPIFNIVMLTVLFSVILHGMSAAPLAKRYGSRFPETTDR